MKSLPLLHKCHDPDLVSNCTLWGRSIDRMASSAANVVASARELEYEQLLYRTHMQAQAAELKAAMLEPTFTSEMQSKRNDETRRTISQFMSRLTRGGSDQVPLTEAVTKMTETARALNQSVNEEELMTGQGSLGEYLLDICAVSGEECDWEAQFVVQSFDMEMCCDRMEVNSQRYFLAPHGLVPILGAHIHLASDGSVTRSGWSICPLDCMARRLQHETTIEEEEKDRNVNVCGLAYLLSNGNIAQKINELAALPGGPDQMATHEASQTSAYLEFYGDVCRTVEHVRSPSEDTDPLIVSEFVSGRKLQDNDPEPNVYLQACRLSTTVSAIEEPSGGWAGSEFQCQDATWLDDDALANTCQDYCGDALFLILGHSRCWGFAQERMDQVCLQPDSSVDGIFNQSHVDVCHERASTFHLLKQRIADFVSKMEVLQATQTLFKGRTQRLFESLSRELGARLQGELDRADTLPGAKIIAFKLLVNNILDEQTGSTRIETDGLKEALQDMVSAATTLQATLSTALPGMQAFLSECNILTTGTGANYDYLLDMCAQAGQQCIDEHDEVQHVGCCCACNPTVKLARHWPIEPFQRLGKGQATWVPRIFPSLRHRHQSPNHHHYHRRPRRRRPSRRQTSSRRRR